MICSICPRKCCVDREKDFGYCHSPNDFKVARAALHFWEEPCISGKKGSGTVFFTGCNLKCVYCQNHSISFDDFGKTVSEDELIKIFENLINSGAENINLVNPTHYAVSLAKLFKKWQCPVPVVYNSGGYESVETLKLLNGIVDIYLPDFKYIRQDKAKKYSLAPDYPQVAEKAIAEMLRQVPKCVFDENGIMKKGVIIRHLILPQNTNSATEIIDYVAKNFPGAYLSLMAQYVPVTDLKKYPEINRKISKREYEKVVNHAIEINLENVFVQQLSSATDEYIPKFDLTGVENI